MIKPTKGTDPVKKAARKAKKEGNQHFRAAKKEAVKQLKAMPAAKWGVTPAAKRGETKRQGIRSVRKIGRK